MSFFLSLSLLFLYMLSLSFFYSSPFSFLPLRLKKKTPVSCLFHLILVATFRLRLYVFLFCCRFSVSYFLFHINSILVLIFFKDFLYNLSYGLSFFFGDSFFSIIAAAQDSQYIYIYVFKNINYWNIHTGASYLSAPAIGKHKRDQPAASHSTHKEAIR